METLFIVLAFVGTFAAGFFCCLFLACCVLLADMNHKARKEKTNGENTRAQYRSRDVF